MTLAALTSILRSLAKMLGLPGILAIAALIYWEGLPIIREIPGVRHIPIVGTSVDRIAQGRVGMQYRAGREDAMRDQRTKTVEQILERTETDEQVQNMDRVELCDAIGGVLDINGRCH